ncbi:hypothetical protein [Actinomadura harenae]|uniref:hypothetical protein n=1 Tax=Actinomadura harenae TaxID=2483351 RepID=UPI001F2ADED1|nr:hypothetical protein [Actinomadura harenae]
MQNILWTPQWGAARNVTACPACAQRWAVYQQQMSTGQPGYPAPQPGYPAPQPGYPVQPGYPAAGYPQPGYDHDYDHHHDRRRGPGWAGVAAAGAAGLVGGALINEMLDDDEPKEQVIYEVTNNEYNYDSDDDNW